MAVRRPAPAYILARAQVAWRHLECCDLCPLACGVDRLAGETGQCGADANARVFAQDVLVGEELQLTPSYGIRLAGCNLRCPYCNVWDYSQDASNGAILDSPGIEAAVTEAARCGCVNVHLMGGEPTIFLPQILEIAAHTPDHLRFVLNSNLYWSDATRELLRGVVDTWVVDMRVGSADCCTTLGAPPDYVAAARRNLKALGPNEDAVLRHLALPGHIGCCAAAVIRYAAQQTPWVTLNPWLDYFPPPPGRAHPALCRPPFADDRERLQELAHASGLRLVAPVSEERAEVPKVTAHGY